MRILAAVFFWTALGISILAVGVPKNAAAFEVLPSSPLQPTYSDCGRLSSQFYNNHLRPAHARVASCMRQKPRFGWGRTCSGKPTYLAWSQCEGERAARCQLKEAWDREMAICRQRARAASNAKQRALRDTMDVIRKAERSYKKAKSLYKKAGDAYRFANDPVSYLKKKLNPFPSVVNRLFTHQPTRDLSSFDQNLGYQLYNYAHQSAVRGFSVTPNPVVRAIQQNALKHLKSEYSKTLSELALLSRNIENFKINSASPPLGKIDRPPGYVPESRACKVIGLC